MGKIININQKVFDINEVKSKIPSVYTIVFFSPVEWIDEIGLEISKFYTNSIGSSSANNITKDYTEYNSVSFLGIKCTDVKLCLLNDITHKMISYYNEIADFKEIYKKDHSILLEFTDGLSSYEESVLTVISNELPGIPLIGASAGDNTSFTETKVCVNGVCSTNSTALCLLTTDLYIETYCENIYEPTKNTGFITDSDLFERRINTINNIPATKFYCNALGISESEISHNFMEHPIIRIDGSQYFIASPQGFEGTSLKCYSRPFTHSFISICKPIDYISLWEDISTRNRKDNKYLGGIFVNCLFRTMRFSKDHSLPDFQKYLSTFGEFICITSYGEQFNEYHANQTMTCCLFRES